MSSSRRSGWERCTRRRRSAMTRRGGIAVVGAVRGRVGSGRAQRHRRASPIDGHGPARAPHPAPTESHCGSWRSTIRTEYSYSGWSKAAASATGSSRVPWPPATSGASELACRRRRAAAQRGVLTRRLRPSQPPLHRRRLPPRDRRLRQAAERDVGLRGRAPLRCRAGNTPTGQRFTTYSARVCPR
jgi:hypothetical protein